MTQPTPARTRRCPDCDGQATAAIDTGTRHADGTRATLRVNCPACHGTGTHPCPSARVSSRWGGDRHGPPNWRDGKHFDHTCDKPCVCCGKPTPAALRPRQARPQGAAPKRGSTPAPRHQHGQEES